MIDGPNKLAERFLSGCTGVGLYNSTHPNQSILVSGKDGAPECINVGGVWKKANLPPQDLFQPQKSWYAYRRVGELHAVWGQDGKMRIFHGSERLLTSQQSLKRNYACGNESCWTKGIAVHNNKIYMLTDQNTIAEFLITTKIVKPSEVGGLRVKSLEYNAKGDVQDIAVYNGSPFYITLVGEVYKILPSRTKRRRQRLMLTLPTKRIINDRERLFKYYHMAVLHGFLTVYGYNGGGNASMNIGARIQSNHNWFFVLNSHATGQLSDLLIEYNTRYFGLTAPYSQIFEVVLEGQYNFLLAIAKGHSFHVYSYDDYTLLPYEPTPVLHYRQMLNRAKTPQAQAPTITRLHSLPSKESAVAFYSVDHVDLTEFMLAPVDVHPQARGRFGRGW